MAPSGVQPNNQRPHKNAIGVGQALIIDAVRTPYGVRGGALSAWHPVDLAAEVLALLIGRNGIDGTVVEDVILGCTTPVGSQAWNIARRARWRLDGPKPSRARPWTVMRLRRHKRSTGPLRQ